MENIIENLYKKRVSINKFLGNENNASVYEGLLNVKNKNLSVIVKAIPRKDLKYFSKLLLEIGFLKYLSKFVSSKKYICLYYSIKLTPEYLIIVQEMPSGITLTQFVQQISSKTDKKEYYRLILITIYKLLLALNYIHTKGVAHRAINPDTIYISYNEETKSIIDLKITDFSVSCGKYVELDVNSTMWKQNNMFCESIDLMINPPEKFNIDKLVKQIQELTRNNTNTNQSRETAYLYLAKKADIWSLGIIFWKLLNFNSIQNPLLLKFPENYQTDKSWMTFNGIAEDKLIPNIFKIVVKLMLSEIPNRGKSNEILENFIILNKYYDDYDDNLKRT
jgi:serine/threonine protein kinase